jgi:hypothetical protein
VEDGVTGALFKEPSAEALAAAARAAASCGPAPCRASAERFSEDRFDRAIGAEISALLGHGGPVARPAAAAR